MPEIMFNHEFEDYVQIKQELRAMFAADSRCGCGFYGDDEWMRAYGRLQYLCGFDGETSVFDKEFVENLKSLDIKEAK